MANHANAESSRTMNQSQGNRHKMKAEMPGLYPDFCHLVLLCISGIPTFLVFFFFFYYIMNVILITKELVVLASRD